MAGKNVPQEGRARAKALRLEQAWRWRKSMESEINVAGIELAKWGREDEDEAGEAMRTRSRTLCTMERTSTFAQKEKISAEG